MLGYHKNVIFAWRQAGTLWHLAVRRRRGRRAHVERCYSRFALVVYQVYESLERAIGLARERSSVVWRRRKWRKEEEVTGEQAVSKHNRLS